MPHTSLYQPITYHPHLRLLSPNKFQIMLHNRNNLLLKRLKLKAKYLSGLGIVHLALPRRRLHHAIKLEHTIGILLGESPLDNLKGLSPLDAAVVGCSRQKVLVSGNFRLQSEDVHLGNVVDVDAGSGKRVVTRIAENRTHEETVGSFGDGGCFGDGVVAAENEDGEDVDDVEGGFFGTHKVLACLVGEGFGGRVGGEVVGEWTFSLDGMCVF